MTYVHPTKIQDMIDNLVTAREETAAMPETGSVLWFPKARLCLGFADQDPRSLNRPFACHLRHARIFRDDERQGPNRLLDLNRSYTNGSDERAMLYAVSVVKREQLADTDAAIRILKAQVDIEEDAGRMGAETDQEMLDNAN
jgi:hypothetical protein